MEYSKINQHRRAINYFDADKQITPEQLREIYDAAKLAPTSFNLQPYKVIVAHSGEIKEKLMAVGFNQPKIKEASAVLVIFGYKKAYLHWDDIIADFIGKGYLKEGQADMYKGMAKSLYQESESEFVSRNAGLFAMNFMLAAADKGWETHPMDGMDKNGVSELFGLGEDYLPVMMIAIGSRKPETKALPRLDRKKFEQVFEIK